MRRLWILVLLVVVAALGAEVVMRWGRGDVVKKGVAATQRGGAELKILLSNIRIADAKDGVNQWPNRRALLVDIFKRRDADVIGMQEVSPPQAAYLIKELPGYGHYPDGREGGEGALAPLVTMVASLNLIMYKADRFEVVESSAGPVQPVDAAADPRTTAFYSLVVLKDKRGELGETLVVDTHLRHNVRVATLDAMAINNRITAVRRTRPGVRVVLMGDMNWDRNSAVYGGLIGAADSFGVSTPRTELRDTYDYAAKGKTERWGSWHNFTGQAMAVWPSDLVLVSEEWAGTGPAEIVREHAGVVWPSDHFLVSVVLW